MKKYWYRRILIMALVFFVSVGGSYLLIEQKKDAMRREVSAQTSEEDLVIPGGMPVGIYMKTKGVMVLDTQKIKGEDGAEYEPALHIVKAGDYITGFNGKDINTKNELVEAVSSFSEQKAKLDICRKGETIHVKMNMIQCEDGTKKLGIWVRDNAQGLGTITYLDSDSHFGALGHGIHDIDTGELLNISDGTLYLTSVKEIQKGVNGTPGGMEGIIVYNNYNVLGKIKKNTEAGIFGTIDRVDVLFANQTPVQLAKKEDEIVIQIGEGKHGIPDEAYVAFDGVDEVELTSGDMVEIRKAEAQTRIIKLNQDSFLETLRRKMKGN